MHASLPSQVINGYRSPTCWAGKSPAFTMTAGTIKTQDESSTSSLCNTGLYFDANDQDSKNRCADDDHGAGPGWSCGNGYFVTTNTQHYGCPMDDPGDNGPV